MDKTFHRLPELFAQLGLPADHESIKSFLAAHAPLPDDVRVEDAAFWTPTQAEFLRKSLIEDADWTTVVDRLNTALRQP